MNQKIISLILGILLFLSVVLTFSYFQNKSLNDQKNINIGDSISLIKDKKIKEIKLKHSQAELKDLDGNILNTTVGDDSMREMLLQTVVDFNITNENAPIKMTVEAASSGLGWILLANNIAFLAGFIFCLLISFYLGSILSRNKG